MAKLAADTTLFCGSGVSLPSGLPDGQELARVAFDLVVAGSRTYSDSAVAAVHDALRWPLDGEPKLRLELVLDLMSRHVPAHVLAGVYTLALDADPCLAHFILAAAHLPVVTTNQDELVERAAIILGVASDVLHVHGLASRPQSIVTMLSQYVKGLPASTARKANQRIAGRRLVVLGYSGRDLDVMPHLYDAAAVTWLHYQPGAGPPPATEVRALQAALGTRMRVIDCADPAKWLLNRLPVAACRAVVAARTLSSVAPHSTAGLTTEAMAEFRRICLIDRRLAIGRVLLHIGQAEAARDGLQRAARSRSRDPEIQLMIADALVTLQRRPAAIRRYLRATALTSDPRIQASAMLGCAHTRANSAAYEEALQDLLQARRLAHQIADTMARDSQEAWIDALRARIHAMTDGEDAAIRLYRHVAALARRTGNLDLRVTALVFGSDLFRSRGLYKQALDRLALIFDDNELYGRPYTRVWGRFYRGATLCATGSVAEGISDLENCRDNAGLKGNHQAMAWASLAMASYLRCQDLDAAQQAITDCANAIDAYGKEMILCEVRLAWERAELARARGAASEALRQITALRKRLAGPSFPVHLPYMLAHVLALEGEVARFRAESAAHNKLRQARAIYVQGKWQHHTARIDVSLWQLSGRHDPPRALLERCRRRNYAEEVDYLTNPRPGYWPLHGL